MTGGKGGVRGRSALSPKIGTRSFTDITPSGGPQAGDIRRRVLVTVFPSNSMARTESRSTTFSPPSSCQVGEESWSGLSPHAHPRPHLPRRQVISHSLYRQASRRREQVTLIVAFSLVDDPLPQSAQHHHTQSKGKSAIDNPSWACHWVCLKSLSRTQTPCPHKLHRTPPLQGWLKHPACNHSHSLFTNDTPWALR